MSFRRIVLREANVVVSAFIAAVGRLDKSLDINQTIARLQRHQFTLSDSIYVLHIFLAAFWLYVMHAPFYFKMFLPTAFTVALLVPFTSQFFLPAIPVFAWVLTFFCSRFIPVAWRPSISVTTLPTLESVLYGANISDILTRFTNPALDVLAWLPYGVIHFLFPFVVAAFLWLFRPKHALHLWARTFGYMNLCGVLVQILFPCAAPWYELIYGLTPATYATPGSAGGLARIDAIFHSQGYATAFATSPVVFGAFPSLHAGCATIEALFISHFFPQATRYVWTYAAVLYWATMYLTHHYLIDVTCGACLAVAFFYAFLPDELCGAAATSPPSGAGAGGARNKYAIYDLDPPPARRAGRGLGALGGAAVDDDGLGSEASDEEVDIAYSYRSPVPGGTPTAVGAGAFAAQQQKAPPKGKGGAAAVAAEARSHRHTASIASLIREGDRVEEGWSPIGSSFAFPGTPTRASERDAEVAGRV